MHIDVFNGDAFRLLELVGALNRIPYVPGWLGTLNLFTPRPVRTAHFDIEEKTGVLSLIKTSARGAPLDPIAKIHRQMRTFKTARLATQDTLQAAEIADIRAFGTESELQQAQDEVMQRQVRLRTNLDLTLERWRLGAVQGIVLDSDDTVLINWYTAFGLSQPAEIDFDLYNSSPDAGALLEKCKEVTRAMEVAAQGAWIENRTYPIGLCGDTFYDRFQMTDEYREQFKATPQAMQLQENLAYRQFMFGGILFKNYRGTDAAVSDGAGGTNTVAIASDECKFFPVNVAPDTYLDVMSPGEFFPVVNTPGQPFYPLVVPDPTERQAYVDIELYAYRMMVCTRPRMLQRATAGTS